MNEAKALDEELTEGVGQAKNYAGKLAMRYAYAKIEVLDHIVMGQAGDGQKGYTSLRELGYFFA